MRKQVIKKQETAVNFLVDQLDTKFPDLDWDKVEKAIQKAFEMEKEQMKDAILCEVDKPEKFRAIFDKQFDVYYSETYNNDRYSI